MHKEGPIVIIEDDLDDQDTLKAIFGSLNYENELVFFQDGHTALEYLTKTDVIPFLILSDLNMPKMSGFDLRNEIFMNEKLQTKCIPYLFFTTAADKKSVQDAYRLSIQGFFTKPNTYTELQNTMETIVTYWQKSISPNEFD